MNLLLDTHTLVWAILLPARLGKSAATAIANPGNEILVSAASAWEIATKVRLGKFPEAVPLERRFLETVADAGYTMIAIEPEVALRAGRLTASHGDPFDRIIAAHALALDIPIISKDPQLDQFGIRRIW